jgi:hypothetical protein
VNGASRFLATLTVFVSVGGCGGGSSTTSSPSAPPPPPLQLSASVAALNLGNTDVGMTSPSQSVSVQANGGSVTITNIAAMDPFQVASVSVPVTLSANQSLTLSVTFKPTTPGAVSAADGLSIVSDATNSPSVVSLSGTGTSSTGGGGGGGGGPTSNPCVGSSVTQVSTNVTQLLSQVSAGITVLQVTNNNMNWNTYADVPTYSPSTGVMTYNSFGSSNSISTANPDGSNAQTISGSQQGETAYVSVDGKFIYYQGQNPNQTADIYAVPIALAGACQQTRLTNTNWIPVAPLGSIVISTSSLSANGHNVIAYSGDTILHRVQDDGTALPDVTLGDSENQNVFHRMRLNPVFPNILWYKRDQPVPNPSGAAEPEIWVVNLDLPSTVYSVAGSAAADHASWSIDGTEIGYHVGGVWYTAKVLNTDGTFNLNGTGFTSTKIGPPQGFSADANYCVWAPDGSVYVCTGGAVPGSPVYLMSLDGTQVKYLSATDSTGTVDAGIPKAQFFDMQHILFSSDRGGTAQVYVITGFTTTF